MFVPDGSCSSEGASLTLERIAHPRRRRGPAAPASVTPAAATNEPASHILCPRTEDLGATWPAHTCRREKLPAQLDWAGLLLDPEQPLAVRCDHEQARRLLVWHNHLPTYQQISFSCQRLAHRALARERS